MSAAIAAIRSHVARGGLEDDMVLDAVRVRLIEIGEAVKAIDDDLLGTESEIPGRQIARMRDHLAHRYVVTSREVIRQTVDEDLGRLESAVDRMRRSLPDEV